MHLYKKNAFIQNYKTKKERTIILWSHNVVKNEFEDKDYIKEMSNNVSPLLNHIFDETE